MAKASASMQWRLQWRYLLNLTEMLPRSEQVGAALQAALQQLPQQLPRRWSGPAGWLGVTLGGAVLLYWNGRLVVATGVGVATMLLIYLMHDGQISLPWAEIRKRLDSWNQPVALAIAGGGLACLSTYLAASIWMDSESAWIALGSLLQGAGTLAVLLLVTSQVLQRQTSRDRIHYNQILADLTHTEPLRRLVAVRHLISTVPDLSNQPAQLRELADYFRLVLRREREPIVQEAALEGLERLDRLQALKQAQPSVQAPAQQTAKRRRLPAR